MLLKNHGFLPRRLVENLILDENTVVSGDIVKYLVDYQLNGIRFLYKNYKQKYCCILNDESELGKCVQTVAFLSSIIKPKTNNVILIICMNKCKILEWKYHFNKITKFNVIENDEINSGEIYLIDIIKFNQSIDLITLNKWKYIIVDERLSTQHGDENLFKIIKSIECKNKLFIISDDITKNLQHFYDILKIFNIKNFYPNVHEFFSHFNTNNKLRDRENIFNYSREFRLRRYKHQIVNFQQIGFHRFKEKLKTEMSLINKKINIMENQNTNDYFQFDSSFEIDLNSNIDSATMSPLVYKSDNEEILEKEIVVEEFGKNKSQINESKEILPNTNEFSENSYLDCSYMQCGQKILSQNIFGTPAASIPSEKEIEILSLSLTNNSITVESSNDVEIVKDDIVTIVINSSSENYYKEDNNNNNLGCISPDLFADYENELIEKNNNATFLNTSTPIESNYPEETHNNSNILNETYNTTTNHFEITKNSDFYNIIRVNDDLEMSPLRVNNSDSDEIILINKANTKLNPILNTPTSSVKLKNGDSEKTPQQQITESGKRKSTPDSSSKWLSAKKLQSTESTPRSHKRRRNLDKWFQNSF